MKKEFEENGFYVLRGVLTEAEVDRLAAPIRGAFTAGDYDGYKAEAAYPAPGIYSMGPRILEKHPEIAEISFAHPAIVNAIEELFSEPATLAQYWSIMRPPGAGVADGPFVAGSNAHFDYKPWRCVGSLAGARRCSCFPDPLAAPSASPPPVSSASRSSKSSLWSEP